MNGEEMSKKEYDQLLLDRFAIAAMTAPNWQTEDQSDSDCANRAYEIADAMFAERTRRMLDLESVSPTPTNPTAPVQVWPLPPNLRVPRLAADGIAKVRSTGEDSTGAYFEDFYPPGSENEVYRDSQGYFVIEAGKEYVTYLNPPGSSIEHRIVPRPNSGSNDENRA